MHLTAILRQEGDIFAAFCPELDVASQGSSIEEAKANLTEAVELFLDVADDVELATRYQSATFISNLEVKVG